MQPVRTAQTNRFSPAREQGPSRLLLVDDQPFFLATTKEILTAAGFLVQTASNGPAALEVARMHRPDAVLLDVAMPGFDGFETCRRLRAHPVTSRIPVIFLTASTDARLTERAFAVRAQATLQKGASIDRLRNLLQLLLASSRAPAQRRAPRVAAAPDTGAAAHDCAA